MSTIRNPILPGCNPDPNILRVGDTYYIIVSTFEWLPGIRVYSSKNLINWRHETDILTTQVNLRGNPLNGGIWAPQLSYYNGIFYCTFTDVKNPNRPFKDCHNYLVTSHDIHGPWSDPIYLNSSGFDPSFFHENGKSWLLNELWDYRLQTSNKSVGIILQEYDEENKELVGSVYKIFNGTQLKKTEAPHLYKHNDMYYLITAEGGTGFNHSVTVCRSNSLIGPYQISPVTPLLTASDKPSSILQCSGHASLVHTIVDKWYIVFLVARPINGKTALLGRETAIQEVHWTDEGWLKLSSGGTGPNVEVDIEGTTAQSQKKRSVFRDDFCGSLSKEWNSLRLLPDDKWCDLNVIPGKLRVLSGESLQSHFDPHMLAVRQKDFSFVAETQLSFEPHTFNQLAGLIYFLNENNYLYCYLTYDEILGTVLLCSSCKNSHFVIENQKVSISNKTITIQLRVTKLKARFFFKNFREADWIKIGEVQELSSFSGGYTGCFVGLSVQDVGKKEGCYADFEYFEYRGKDM